MLEPFLRFMEARGLVPRGGRVLLAVSGGIDSMVMLHLFRQTDIPFLVAHCNFRLRGRESDGDERFVKDYCKTWKIPFASRKFQTERHAKRNKVSVQMAARALRYAFFSELADREGCVRTATAHNLDDVAETMLLNLVRGTGTAGLHGIAPRNGTLIRPLLFATRDRIRSFARKDKLPWREDSSNASEKYVRNKLRKKVMPVLAEINPSVLDAFRRHGEAVSDAEAIYKEYVGLLTHKLLVPHAGGHRIDVAALKKHAGTATLLFEMLRGYGFNRTVAEEIARGLDGATGKVFLAPGYRLVKDRKHLLLHAMAPGDPVEHLINEGVHHFPWEGGMLHLRKLALTFDMQRKLLTGQLNDPRIAWLDAAKLEFPLHLRPWNKGDAFHPLGMKGKKKLSDFFTDRKYSLAKKKNTWLLLSGADIAWVVGDRIDDRFKVDASTSACLEIVFEPK